MMARLVDEAFDPSLHMKVGTCDACDERKRVLLGPFCDAANDELWLCMACLTVEDE
jgi:hypothetical protein